MVSLPKNFLRTEEGERVERKDFEHAIFTTPRSILESVINDLLVGTATPGTTIPRNYIVTGFQAVADGTPSGSAPTITYTTSGILTVSRGVAVVGTRIDGQVEFGLTLANGDLTRNQDISGLANGTYGIYIRLEFRDDSFQNRIFWNPLSPTPTETAANIATRRAENWAMAVEAVSPGSEWILIAEVVKTGTTLAITDRREMFWDVSTHDGSANLIVDADWGGGTDRNDDRRLYGVRGLFQTLVAVRRQLQDIIGTTWYDAPPGSLTSILATIAALPNTFLARDGSNTMNSGASLNWADTTGAIGNVQAVDRVQARQFAGANQFTSNAGAEREVLNAAFNDNQQAGPMRALIGEFNGFNDTGGGIYSSAGNETIRLYAAGLGVNSDPDYFEIALNAFFDEDTSTWTRDNTGRASALIRFGPATSGGTQAIFEIDYRANSLADTWADTTVTATGWQRIWFVGPAQHTTTYGAADAVLGIGAAAGDIVISQQTSPETGNMSITTSSAAGVKEWFISLPDIPDGATIVSASVNFGAIGGNVRCAIARRTALGSTAGQSLKTGTPYDVVSATGTTALTIDETETVRTLDRGTFQYYAWFSAESTVVASFQGLAVTWQQGNA
jgi:hypothetical protein